MWELLWNKKYKEIRESYAKLGEKHQQLIRECNEKHQMPRKLWSDIAEYGIYEHGIQYDGQDGLIYLAAAMEGLCYGSGGWCGAAMAFGLHLGFGFLAITNYAKEPVRQKIINDVINKQAIIAIAVTEPHGGSDATKLECTVKKEGEFYILNGVKWNISNAPHANIIVTFAREL